MSALASPATWPKNIPPLSPEHQRISDDFMRHWHEVHGSHFPLGLRSITLNLCIGPTRKPKAWAAEKLTEKQTAA